MDVFFSPPSHHQKVLAAPRDINPLVILMGTVTDQGSAQREGAPPHTLTPLRRTKRATERERKKNTTTKNRHRRSVSERHIAPTFWRITSPGALSSVNLLWLFALPLPLPSLPPPCLLLHNSCCGREQPR